MKNLKFYLIIFVTFSFSQSHFIRAETPGTQVNNADVISEVIKFCFET